MAEQSITVPCIDAGTLATTALDGAHLDTATQNQSAGFLMFHLDQPPKNNTCNEQMISLRSHLARDWMDLIGLHAAPALYRGHAKRG